MLYHHLKLCTEEDLQKAATPDQIFTLCRIMFLATASPSALILSLVEDKRHGRTIIDVLAMKMDMMMASLLADKTFARDAVSELLKFAFNILHHYPEVCPRAGIFELHHSYLHSCAV